MRVRNLTSIFVACLCCISPSSSFAQWDEEPLEVYDVIEQRNIFRPKSDSSNTVNQEDSVFQNNSRTVMSDFNRRSASSLTVDHLHLTGIVKLNGTYKAIIEKKDGGNGFYVKVNDYIEDYVVHKIKRDQVVLIKNEKQYILKLDLAKKKHKKLKKKKAAPIESTIEPPKSNKINLPADTNIMRRLRTGVFNDKN
ncbi:MAG: hypothetical protein KAR05_02625 [Candidatus Omnitrophica bacterium]|nr:hypothetical protein [Candidatus Omnitrophota bacterium]